MKKQHLKGLSLNKKTISAFDVKKVKGGTDGNTTFAPGGCIVDCPEDSVNLTNDPGRAACHTVVECGPPC